MDYLTNFYKNRCDQLQEQIVRLEGLLEYAMAASAEATPSAEAAPTSVMAPPPQQGPPQQGPTEKPSEPMQGDGLAPGYEKPHQKGPKSDEWKKWIRQPGRWHRSNPHPFGSPQFYQWEWDYYQVPPV